MGLARGYGEKVSAEPARPPLSMRFQERTWTRVDWALAAVCAVLVYSVMFRGHGFYMILYKDGKSKAHKPFADSGCRPTGCLRVPEPLVAGAAE